MRHWVIFLFIACLGFSATAKAQVTVVRGTIYDGDPSQDKKTPLPFANVILEGTTIGGVTDFEGRFELKTDQKPQYLRVNLMGYRDTLVKIRPGAINDVKITLPLAAKTLGEFELKYKRYRNPALVVIDSVKTYRKQNDPFRFPSVEAEVYTKNQLDAYNLPEKMRKSKLGRVFKPFYELSYQDSRLGDTNTYYPFMLIEMVSNVYRKKGASIREIIHKFDITGVENDQLAPFMSATFQNFNFYDDNQLILGKNFIGPLSPFGSAYYKYTLEDSLMVGDMRCYQIRFEPMGLSQR